MTAAIETERGTVKWFSGKRGIGFVTPAGATDPDANLYFHISNVIGSQAEADLHDAAVSFIRATDWQGRPIAREVTVLSAKPEATRKQQPKTAQPAPFDSYWPKLVGTAARR